MPIAASFTDLLRRLRAAAEPTRLRVLAACASGELTVSEICAVLEQSQPRVSRHLRLLCDAGLLARFREEHWVYYRTPVRGAAAQNVRELLQALDAHDPIVVRDRLRAAAVRAQRAAIAAAHLRPEPSAPQELSSLQQALEQELGKDSVGELLDIGTGTGRMLRWLAPRATRAVGVDLESDALRIARTTVHTAGLSHCELRRGDMYALPYESKSFDTIAMDRLLGDAERPGAALAEAARLLKPGGRLVIIEDFDGLESREAPNPLATLRQWLRDARLECQRLRPVEAGAHHLLLAIGRRSIATNLAA